jgi:hypothetical protein
MDWREWRNWSKRRRWVTGALAVLVLLIVIGAMTGNHKRAHVSTTAKVTQATSPTTTTAPTPKPKRRPKRAPKPKPRPTPKPYARPASFFINVTAAVAGSHIQVGGSTNLPDGTVLTINAERAFKQTHDDERVDFLGLNGPTDANVSVHHGRFSGVLSSLEHNLAPAFKGEPGGPVATIDPDAEVCVVLYTGRGSSINGPFVQPAQVRADIGTDGKFLRGSPGVGTFGSLTKHPSEDMVATQRVPLDASAFARGFAEQQAVAAASGSAAECLRCVTDRATV